ncbi:MAG TPA: carboxymuconolactone decarboxylase family protein [Candidatus Saccharimonadales bacterium]|nr:carboxymuconolactone decarboxylase family protein [Candidatus Saccharimonadales bacterium]
MPKKEIDKKQLPLTLQQFIKKYPRLWSAHESLGMECAHAGPLSEKEIQLIKIAVTGSLTLETAFKTHVQKSARAGASKREIEHTIIQLLPILGMGRTMMAMKWYHESLNRKR